MTPSWVLKYVSDLAYPRRMGATSTHDLTGDWPERRRMEESLVRFERALGDAEEDFRVVSTTAGVECVRHLVHCDKALDYDVHGNAFAAAFLRVNFRKAFTALAEARPQWPLRIGDIGAGAGSAGIAAVAYASALRPGAPLELYLVDCDAGQLARAERVLGALRGVMPDEVMVQLVRDDIQSWVTRNTDGFDLVLASHVLTENVPDAAKHMSSLPEVLAPSGNLLIIERADDGVGAILQHAASAAAVPLERRRTAAEPSNVTVDDRPWELQWLLSQRPNQPWLPALVDAYFRCWNEHDIETLESVFTANAVYREKPFAAPLVGLQRIREYWRDVVGPQDTAHARTVSVSYHGLTAHVEWVADFNLNCEAVSVRGSMVLAFDPEQRKIAELREYFRTQKRCQR
jgi:SAM-dependent methyltransferase